jgi:CheY-like chemotaxis protein
MNGDDGVSSNSMELPDSGSINVLHIEDEPHFAKLVATYLEREDERFSVRTETDPYDALNVLYEDGSNVDCIVSDYEMTDLDGLEVLDRVRETHSDLPFILFTRNGSEGIASDAISAGVTDYLQKETGTDQYRLRANSNGKMGLHSLSKFISSGSASMVRTGLW